MRGPRTSLVAGSMTAATRSYGLCSTGGLTRTTVRDMTLLIQVLDWAIGGMLRLVMLLLDRTIGGMVATGNAPLHHDAP